MSWRDNLSTNPVSKSFFEKDFESPLRKQTHSESPSFFCRELEKALAPILAEWVEKGFPTRELEHLTLGTVISITAEMRVRRQLAENSRLKDEKNKP